MASEPGEDYYFYGPAITARHSPHGRKLLSLTRRSPRSRMTKLRRSRNNPQSPREGIAAEIAGARGLEAALRGARDRLEEDVLAWNAGLTAAISALGLLDSPKNTRLSEARERLERLEVELRQAPGQIVEDFRRRATEFASTSTPQLRRIGKHEVAESNLTTTNEQLRLEVSERKRLEREARRVERGLREVRERFESAF